MFKAVASSIVVCASTIPGGGVSFGGSSRRTMAYWLHASVDSGCAIAGRRQKRK